MGLNEIDHFRGEISLPTRRINITKSRARRAIITPDYPFAAISDAVGPSSESHSLLDYECSASEYLPLGAGFLISWGAWRLFVSAVLKFPQADPTLYKSGIDSRIPLSPRTMRFFQISQLRTF